MTFQASRGPVYGADGVIASPHYLASLAGVTMLRDGGSAVDAAIAANAVLAVVWPHQCGPGGDLFAQVWSPGSGLIGFNGSGRSGSAMSGEAYRAAGLAEVPSHGALSVTVPGAIDGWISLHDRWGRLERAQVFAPAIRYARDGFAATPRLCKAISQCEAELRSAGAAWFLPRGHAPSPGDRIAEPELAVTLERVALEGRSVLHGGDVGRRVSEIVAAEGGLLTERDIAAHAGEWVSPLETDYRGTTVCELPPNTQGVVVLEMLRLLEGVDVESLGEDSAALIDEVARCKLVAFRDRDRYIGDPSHIEIPLGRMLRPGKRSARPAPKDGPARGAPPAGDTVYLCAADRDGLVVSLIQSIFDTFGSRIVVPGAGFVLHNRGHSFDLNPGSPNVLEPGKRPRHTLIPGFALRGGRPWLAFGTRGADGQPQTAVQLLVGMLDFGRDVAAAVEAPRWVHGMTAGSEGSLVLEARFGQAVVDELNRRGWQTQVTNPFDDLMGTAQLIEVSESRGCYIAASDPRGDSSALAV